MIDKSVLEKLRQHTMSELEDKLLYMLLAKYNELDSLKKHIKDDNALAIIEAKQDTLDDIEKMVKSLKTGRMLNDTY